MKFTLEGIAEWLESRPVVKSTKKIPKYEKVIVPKYLISLYREQTLNYLIKHGDVPERDVLLQLFTDKELFKLSLEYSDVHKEMNK